MTASRRAALMATLLVTAVANAAALRPDFTGVWIVEKPMDALRTMEGKLPPLLPEARAVYDSRVAARKRGDASFDLTLQCQPPGLPRIYDMRMPIEIQQEERLLAMNFQWNRLFRIVDLGITHEQQQQYAPTFFGWSTGNWDGDTLVIDSVLFNDTTLLDAAGLPHSMDMRVTERWRLVNGGRGAEVEVTIEDAGYYASPWTYRLRMRKAPSRTEIQEDVCLERRGLVKPKPASATRSSPHVPTAAEGDVQESILGERSRVASR